MDFKNWLSNNDFTGSGLVCFDFDKTLTLGKRYGSWVSSTPDPNVEMLNLARKYKQEGNKVIIVTSRSVNNDKYTGLEQYPSISAVDAIKKWGMEDVFDDIIFTGAVSQNADRAESKSPKILFLMKKYKLNWAVLYDDTKKNVDELNKLGSQGFPVKGILVNPKS